MKKLICILLILATAFSLCACGGSVSYGVNAAQVLVPQDYYLGFRNNDPLYFYVTAGLSVLAAEGRVEALSSKWLGNANAVAFARQADALDKLQPPEPRTLIVGIDINSFPFAYDSNGEYWGYDVELSMALCEKLGWTLQLQVIDKNSVGIELSSGNIDVAWGGIALSEADLDNINIVAYGPYIHNDIVVATRNGSAVWNKLRLSGRKMVMSSTPEAMEALNTDPSLVKRLGQITRLAGGTTECFEYMYTGKCDVILTDSTALDYYNCH